MDTKINNRETMMLEIALDRYIETCGDCPELIFRCDKQCVKVETADEDTELSNY